MRKFDQCESTKSVLQEIPGPMAIVKKRRVVLIPDSPNLIHHPHRHIRRHRGKHRAQDDGTDG